MTQRHGNEFLQFLRTEFPAQPRSEEKSAEKDLRGKAKPETPMGLFAVGLPLPSGSPVGFDGRTLAVANACLSRHLGLLATSPP